MAEITKRPDRAEIAKRVERAEKLLQKGKTGDALEEYTMASVRPPPIFSFLFSAPMKQ